MKIHNIKLLATVVLTGILFACNDDDLVSTDDPQDGGEDGVAERYIIQEALLNQAFLQSFELTTAQLEDGTTDSVFVITFASNAVEGGPFCPRTIDDIAGLGIYDGATDPGMHAFAREMLENIEADGYDMVNDDGTVNVFDFSSGMPNTDVSWCLEALPDDNLELTFTIPAYPKLAASNNEITQVEFIGLSLDGISINGSPPSAVNGPTMGGPGGPGGTATQINFPSFDPCGGHHDPSGYYHWHFAPQVMNQVLANNAINEVTCTEIAQTSDATLFGFAKDGFPIYAYAVEPTDLDECGGHTAVTTEYPDGVYHYVASNTSIPNIPVCLKGVAAQRAFSFN